jgi:predicted dehydrogenase
MYDIGVAVAGAGFIGPVHIEALRRLGIRVTGILGCDEKESNSAKQRLGLPKAYRSFEELLADPQAQAVHLAVPNVLHYAMAKQVLAAKKHVMCEKPLAMNSKESAELVELAAKAGVAAGVNYNVRYYPLCLEAAQRIRNGDLGEIFHVAGSYVQDWLLYPTDYNWRVLADQGGALRAVADIGTHWLDLIQFITGRHVEGVCADLKTVHPIRQRPKGEVQTFTSAASEKHGLDGRKGTPVESVAPSNKTEPVTVTTEDYGCIMLRFAGGARGCLWVSQVTAGRKNCLRFEIAGAKAAYAWCSEQPSEMWIGHRERPNESMLRDPSMVSDAVRPFVNYPGGHNEGFPDTFKQCYRAFYDYITAGDPKRAPTFPTFADGHREIVLCEAILESHRSRSWVEIKGGVR